MKASDFKDDFALFLETGFIAINQQDEKAAIKLFECCEILDPENILPKVGFGYLHIHKLELNEAVKCFEEVLKKESDNEMAKTFMGLSYSLMPNGLEKGEKLLLEMSKNAKEETVKTLADTALDFVNRFIKLAPSPAEIKKN